MIVKQHLYVSDPKQFLSGRLDNCFALVGYEADLNGWIYCGEIELEIDIDKQEAINITMQALKKQREEAQAEYATKMAVLDQAEKELLCIEHG